MITRQSLPSLVQQAAPACLAGHDAAERRWPKARATNPLVDQFRKGGVPRDLRLMAAQGALPLKPADLVELLHILLARRRAATCATAADRHADGACPLDEMLPILKDRDTPPGVLGLGVANREERELREAVLQNTATPDEAIEALAARCPRSWPSWWSSTRCACCAARRCSRRWRRTRASTTTSAAACASCARRFRIGRAARGAAARRPPPRRRRPSRRAGGAAPRSRRGRRAHRGRGHGPLPLRGRAQDEEKVSAVQQLYRLNTAEKVITALKGSREERAILVRDPNRIVATAVLGSPRLTEAEIESFAAMKNVSDEILRQIGSHKEWTKRYAVVANLVKNPRTPLGISLSMVPRLNPRDIKSLAVDRNVPGGHPQAGAEVRQGHRTPEQEVGHGRLLRDPGRPEDGDHRRDPPGLRAAGARAAPRPLPRPGGEEAGAQEFFQDLTAAFNTLTNDRRAGASTTQRWSSRRPAVPEEIARDAYERGAAAARGAGSSTRRWSCCARPCTTMPGRAALPRRPGPRPGPQPALGARGHPGSWRRRSQLAAARGRLPRPSWRSCCSARA